MPASVHMNGAVGGCEQDSQMLQGHGGIQWSDTEQPLRGRWPQDSPRAAVRSEPASAGR